MEEEKKVNAEIEEMLTALGDPTPKELKGEEEEPEVEEKEEEAPEEKEEEKEEAPEEKEEKEKEKEEEPEEEEPDKDKVIENLRSRLNEKAEIPTIEKSEEKAEGKKEEPLKIEEQDFIGDLDLDDLVRDKTAFNKILNTVYTKGVGDAKRVATESVLSSIPDIVKHNLTLLTSLKEASDNFYKENEDLTPFKRVVAAVFEEVASKNPDKTYAELMNLTAPEARKRLELHKQAVNKGKGNGEDDGKPPRLHGVKSGQRQVPSKPNTSALEKEISEMNKSLGMGR